MKKYSIAVFVLLMGGLAAFFMGCVPRSRYQRDLSIAKAEGTAELSRLDDRYAAVVKENDSLKSELSKAKDENRRFNLIYKFAADSVKNARADK